MAKNFLGDAKNTKFYPAVSQSGEIDLRDNFQDWIRGSPGHPAKGQILIFRKMRRQTGVVFPVRESDLMYAPGIDPRYNEDDIDVHNDYSKGERFLFDDQVILGYRWQNFYRIIESESIQKYINLPENKDMFFIEWFNEPSRFDKIIEPMINTDGALVSPVRIWRKYDIQEAEPYRGDNGRVEFWRLSVELEPSYINRFTNV